MGYSTYLSKCKLERKRDKVELPFKWKKLIEMGRKNTSRFGFLIMFLVSMLDSLKKHVMFLLLLFRVSTHIIVMIRKDCEFHESEFKGFLSSINLKLCS